MPKISKKGIKLIPKTNGNRKGDCAWSCSRWQTQPEKICKLQSTNLYNVTSAWHWFVRCDLQIFSFCSWSRDESSSVKYSTGPCVMINLLFFCHLLYLQEESEEEWNVKEYLTFEKDFQRLWCTFRMHCCDLITRYVLRMWHFLFLKGISGASDWLRFPAKSSETTQNLQPCKYCQVNFLFFYFYFLYYWENFPPRERRKENL